MKLTDPRGVLLHGFVVAVLGLAFSHSHAVNKFARNSGSYASGGAGGIWFTMNCANTSTTTVPDAGDDVTICAGVTVTLDSNRTVNTITINGTFNAGANTLTIDNTPAFTLNTGGAFNAGTGTVVMNRDSAATLVQGTATTANFNNLTLNPAVGGARVYTFTAGSITQVNIGGTFSITPSGTTARSLTVNMTDPVTVTGATLIQPTGGPPPTTLNTANFAFQSGTLSVQSSGTFTAGSSTVTLNSTTGPLFTRVGAFNADTSNVVMNPVSGSPTLTSGTLTFNDLTIDLAGQTGTLGDTIMVGSDLAIDNGTLADGGFQITGNGTGLLTAAAGAGLTLGTAGTATAFPTLFTAGNTTLNATSTVTYASGVAQNVSSVPTYGNLTFSGASLKTTTPAGTMTIAGDWAIGGAGSSTDLTTNLTPVTMTGASKQISGLVAGSITVPTLTVDGTVTNNATGTVLVSTALSGSGTLTLGTNALLRINGTSGINALTATANPNTVTYGGGAPQTVKAATYHNLIINNASDVSLGGNATVNGELTFTAGDITTSTNTLSIASIGSISGAATASHVVGNLARAFSAQGSFTYTVGDGTNYTPLAVTFFTLPMTGSLTVSATSGDHPDTTGGTSLVRSAQSVNRYWTLKNSTLAGIFSATANYVSPGDLDASATYPNFSVSRGTSCSGTRTCASWAIQSLGAPAPSATQTTATAMSMTSGASESDLAVGESTLPRATREKEFIFTRETY